MDSLALHPEPVAETCRWTAPQQALFDAPYKLTVWWGANGIGKSWALGELTKRAIAGALPWQRPARGGRTVLVVGATWKQLGETLLYFWSDLPAGWFRRGVRFESGALMGQRMPVFDVVGGPGSGGRLILGIFDAEGLAGPRAEVVISDEPLPESVHNELWPRLLGRGGRMYVGFTPTLGTAHKLDYLWELIDDPSKPYIGELQTELTLAAVTPRGGLAEVSWMTGEEIRQLEEGVSRLEADMRMGRTRKPRVDTAYFSAWGPHLRVDWPPPDLTPVGIGIDHGSKPGAQRASLVLVGGRHFAAHVHVLDHQKGDGRTESEEDGRGIVAMIQRNGLRVEDVDVWVGDRAHSGDKWGGKKSNSRLQRAIAQAMGIAVQGRGWMEKLPRPLRYMATPRKYDQSVPEGCEIMHRLMVGRRFTVATKADCNPLVEDLVSWQYRFTDPAKDGIDSVRYVAVPMVEGRRR